MFKRVSNFLNKHDCLYKQQFGFRSKHSTSHAVLSMVQEIREATEQGNTAIGVFVDFKKAFDTVNHSILLKKLDHYGLRNTANNWFRSYLSNRQQQVIIDGCESSLRPIAHGVPQGSVLGPLLFLVYINDLHQSIRNSTTRHFADDTNILHIINNKNINKNPFRKLNADLKSLHNWLLANKISLNAAKTEVVAFRKKGQQLPKGKLILHGQPLDYQNHVKYVGLILDEHLTFQPHQDILNAKLKRANNLLSIARHYVPKDILLQIYYGQFHSHLNYGSQIWTANSGPESTFILQKKAMRIISWSHSQGHSDPLFYDLNILKLADIAKMNNLLFVHNVLNGRAPNYFDNFFHPTTKQHIHNTVNNPASIYSIPHGSLTLPRIQNQQGQKTIKYALAKLWNDFLRELAQKSNFTYRTALDITNHSTFKKFIKLRLLEKNDK